MWTYTGCCGHAAYPVWYWPHQPAHHQHEHGHEVSKELSASTGAPSATATIGGVKTAFLSLDYLRDPGADGASIKINISDSTGTGGWNITSIPDGFQYKTDFLSAAPGATLKLDVTGCTAQLKWYERVL